MIFSRILGTGSFLPKRVVPNSELEQQVDTSDAWIRERTGIESRHLAAEGETTVDLAEQAALRALDAAGMDPSQIELIVLATTTPNQVFPSSACLLQARLGASGCPAFDVQAVCAGFVYALATADSMIRSGMVSNALVLGAETMSRLIDWTDRNTCVLFGDGAGAVVLGASDKPGILATELHADGRKASLLQVPCGVSQGYEQVQAGQAYLQMNGREVFKFAVSSLSSVVEEVLAKAGAEQSQIDWLVPHQANIRIISATAKKLGLPMEQVVCTVAEHGNTSAASIPLALDVAVRDGRIQRGHRLLLEGIGGGFAWGASYIEY